MPTKADLFPVEGEHTGLMIAAWLNEELAGKLAIPGGETLDQLHLTLCYCGDATELSDVQIGRAIAAAAEVGIMFGPLTGLINGIGRFNATESSDNKDVIYANVDVPGLEGMRQYLASTLEYAGCAPLQNHGYTPHITLAYIDPAAPSPVNRIDTQPFVIDALWVSVGDRRTKIDLTGSPIKSANLPAKYAVKALGNNRVGGYMALWGNENNKDLDGEFFTPQTEELTTIFEAMGKLPYLYNHAIDKQVKSSVVGYIDVLQPDDTGLWYEAQLDSKNQYVAAIRKLVAQQALGTSSGTLPGARKVAKSGEILRWATVEGSATPTPADPRQVFERPIAEIKSAFSQIGISFEPESGQSGTGDEESRLEIAAKLKLLDLLSFETELLGV